MAKRTTKSTKKPTRRERPLTPRERLFAHEYVRHHGNGTQAAIAAGYSDDPDSAKVQASRLLTRVNVRALVEKLNAKALGKVDAKAQEVLDELRHVALARLSRVVKLHPADANRSVSIKPLEEWTEHELAALTKVDVEKIFDGAGAERVHVGDIVKLEMKGKQAALETLAKHHKLLVEKVEHEHTGTVYVVDPYGEPPPDPEDGEE